MINDGEWWWMAIYDGKNGDLMILMMINDG